MVARRLFTFSTGVLAVAVLAFAGFATGSSASVGAAGRAAADTFADPAGDSAGAPDVTQVAISDVGATGMIKVAVTVSGIESSATHLFVFLNTDMDDSTGFADGSEYVLSVIPDDQGKLWWDILHWDGTDWQQVPQSATLSYSRAGDVHTWTLSRADLGNPTAPGFTFYVSANGVDAGDNVTASDYAPDSGSWAYLFSAAAPAATTPSATTAAPAAKPVIGVPATVPVNAIAGRHFTVAFRVTRRGAVLDSGTMTCDPSVGGRVIPHAESFAGGTATLSFTVPKTAKGKLLKVKVTIAVDNQSTTRIAAFHVG
jgi:hypothetical protein